MSCEKNDEVKRGGIATSDWAARIVMLSGGLMTALALSAITSVLPQIEAELARGPQDSLLIKQLVGVVGLAMVAGAPLAGFLVDRIGARLVVAFAGALYALSGSAGLFIGELHLLMGSRLLLGIAAAAIATTAMTLINTRLNGIARARWMGAHVGLTMIGTIVLHPVAGWLGESGWRWPFSLYLLGLPISLVGLAIGPHTSVRKAVSDSPQVEGRWPLSWFPARYALLAVLLGSITYMPMVYVPFLMREMGVASPTMISFVLMGDSVLGAAMALLYGRSRQHVSIHGAFAFSLGCAGGGMTVAALSPHVAGVVGGMLFFGLGLGWFVPNLMTAVSQQVLPERQGRAVGLVKGAHYLAAPLCIVAVEPLARQIGPQGAMMVAAALSFALLLVMGYRLRADRRRERSAATLLHT